jgi:plasmid stability protein
MASITIRKLDERVKVRLRIRAAEHGRSMEEEAREILSSAISENPSAAMSVAQSIRKDLTDSGLKGFDLPLYERVPMREPPDFSGPEYGTYGDEDEE